jgi:hypothetical protein
MDRGLSRPDAVAYIYATPPSCPKSLPGERETVSFLRSCIPLKTDDTGTATAASYLLSPWFPILDYQFFWVI